MITTAITNQPRLDSARLASALLESLFNGVYWAHFYTCMQTLRKTSIVRKERLITPIFCVAWLIFLAILTHWIIVFYAAFAAFIPPKDAAYCVEALGPTRATVTYSHLFLPWLVGESAVYVIVTVLADGFLTYRLFVVWSHNIWIVIFPSLALLALLATGMRAVSLFATSKDFIFGASLRWSLAAFALTFVCNVYSTSLIAFRIFQSQRGIQKGRGRNKTLSQKVQEVLVQSAALYSVLVLLSFAFMVVSSNASYITVAITNPMTGIIFCMIVNRTHSHVVDQYERVHGRGARNSGWYNSAASGTGNGNETGEGNGINTSQRASRALDTPPRLPESPNMAETA